MYLYLNTFVFESLKSIYIHFNVFDPMSAALIPLSKAVVMISKETFQDNNVKKDRKMGNTLQHQNSCNGFCKQSLGTIYIIVMTR